MAQTVLGTLQISYGGKEVDRFRRPWARLTVREAIRQVRQRRRRRSSKITPPWSSRQGPRSRCRSRGTGHGKLLTEIFETVAEPHLWNPTFITAYPTEVSPLSRKNDANPEIVDRFELFVAGREIANAFSELNDPHRPEGALYQADGRERRRRRRSACHG